MTTPRSAASLLEVLRREKPLIHHLTNYVTMEFSANALLAVGASPLMAHAPEEISEIISIASALVLNIGTLDNDWVASMKLAIIEAKRKDLPVVLDPVGAGATRYRTRVALELLSEGGISVLRGNASEVLALAGQGGGGKGVDSLHAWSDAAGAARFLSQEFSCTVCVSGETDFITDGSREAKVYNGHSMMTQVTGMGCVATSLIGGFHGISNDAFLATVNAMALGGVCGELAAESATGPASFRMAWLDWLSRIEVQQFENKASYEQLRLLS